MSANGNTLFDLGSQRSFISEKLAQCLKITPLSYERLSVSVFGDHGASSKEFPVCEIFLELPDGSFIAIKSLIVPSISSSVSNYDRNLLISRCPYLKNIDLAPQCQGKMYDIDVLIGADYFWSIAGNRVIRGNGPTCLETRIGFLLSGPTNGTCAEFFEVSNMMNIVINDELDVSEYWNLESLGIDSNVGDNDNDSSLDIDQYIETKLQYANGRYTASLPWKMEHPPLPTNFAIASHVTRKMIRDMPTAKRIQYHSIIQEQLDRNFIEVSPETDTSSGHYLCHYSVAKQSTTTPMRIVYRCNFHTGENPSLNDCLESGITLQPDIGSIVTRFRLFQTVITADVEKAFLRVILEETDRSFTKFLWLKDPTNLDSELVTYRFCAILFGATCSPFILNAVMRKHLSSVHDSPISQTILRNLYVDNLILSVPTNQQAMEIYHESNALMAEAGFNLRSWSSNSKELQDLSTAQNKNAPATDIVNVLGLFWKRSDDTMKCRSLPEIDDHKPITPKSVLRETARLYDVCGFLLPVHIQAKIFLQDLQKAKLGNNNSLTEEQLHMWKTIHHELKSATETVHWPRMPIHNLDSETPVELHIFADASLRSLGCCAYIVANNTSGLIWARNKLTPMTESLRVPRFELNSLVLASNLVKYLTDNLPLNIQKRVLWSDSQIALHWVKSTKKREKYVTNRCTKINNAGFNEIKYCPSRDNPADLVTKSITASELRTSQLWWHGPDWLCRGEQPRTNIFAFLAVPVITTDFTLDLPTIPEEESAQPENLPITHGITEIIERTRFDSMTKLLRTTVYVDRFITRISERQKKSDSKIRHDSLVPTSDELSTARNAWLSKVQTEHFTDEKLCILSKGPSKILPIVRQLNLFLHTDGFIRKRTRLEHANISYNTKYPILVPKNDHFTKLLIREAHSRVLHFGSDTTVCYLRRNYWIPNIYNSVKTVLRECITCKKVNARHYVEPPTPPLPQWRIQEAPPFTTVGIDYTGEVYVKDETGNLKRIYICLFTCASTRAVHLDYVTDMSAQTFLMCFRRFCSRKSTPQRIVSDNASYFQSASNELQKLMRDPQIQEHLSVNGVKWIFIPKRAPWFGAFWERLIGTIKRSIRKVLGRTSVTEYELGTILTEIEAVTNDRPLTVCHSSPDSPTPLTPAHLLYGRNITPLPQTEYSTDVDYEINTKTANERVSRIQKLIQHYWKSWSEQYLPMLRNARNLGDDRRPFENRIQIGDIVLVHHDQLKRPLWKMARVIRLLPGPDGIVRAAEIRTPTGITNRPITKLYPLELRATHESPVKDEDDVKETDSVKLNSIKKLPKRGAAIKAADKIRKMTAELE